MAVSVVIVGGGFSGALTAIRLVSTTLPARMSLTLVDEYGRFGRGVGYRADAEGWRLNAPARVLSVSPDKPYEFVDYCNRHGHPASADSFLPRSLYGDYLADQLRQVDHKSDSHRLRRIKGRVVAVESDRDGDMQVCLPDGEGLQATTVVLVTGPGRRGGDDATRIDALARDPRYFPDPWQLVVTPSLQAEGHFFILGTGLTSFDVNFALARRSPRRRFTSMSRCGLVPQSHAPCVQPLTSEAKSLLLSSLLVPPRQALAVLCESVLVHASLGGNWRDVIDSLRPTIPRISLRWTDAERRALVRHLAAYWDTHRHRCAPETVSVLTRLKRENRLTILVGRLEAGTDRNGRSVLDGPVENLGQVQRRTCVLPRRVHQSSVAWRLSHRSTIPTLAARWPRRIRRQRPLCGQQVSSPALTV
ncbi:FAD/NAD(P)-binding protein [Trinickia sp. NRRL B-1857]|uniref:FAD/NAD(P)-binding protein n=1 Tax=Trinickia sp. NRRL B-1857 TaxID=3162879 RepID=UPI003D2CFA36